MKQVFLALLVITGLATRAQAQAWTFVQSISDANGIMDVATDNNGSVYVTGRFTGTLQLGATQLTSPGLCLYLAKCNAAGQVLRVTKLEGATDVLPTALAVDKAGNAYVTGYFQGTLTYNGRQQAAQLSPSGPDLFTLKCGPEGTVRWLQQVAGSLSNTGSSTALSIALDAAGNTYVTGAVNGTDVRFGTVSVGACRNQGFVASYGTQGTLRWARVLTPLAPGDQSRSRVAAIAIDEAGHGYVSGTFYQGWQLDGETVRSTGSGQFVARLATSRGQLQWVRTPAGEGDARSLATDRQGNAYFADSFSGTITCGAFQLTSAGSSDAFVVRYSPQGNVNWAQALGSPEYDSPNDLEVDQPRGQVLVSGLLNFTAQNTNQAFLARLDPDARGSRPLELVQGPGTSSGGKLAVDAAGTVYATGIFTGSCRFGDFSLTAPATQGYFGRISRPTTGAFAATAATDFSLYPNPAQHLLTLTLPAMRQLAGPAVLYNQQGRAVGNQGAPTGPETSICFDTAALPNGLYVLRMAYQDGETVSRLVTVRH